MPPTLVHRAATYDDAMPELPVSVRVALWATASWRDGAPTAELWQRAAPDLDAVGGDLDRLNAWRSLGEAALLVALPASGHPRGLPACAADARDAAMVAGEAVVAPTFGGLLVPTLSAFGSTLEQGWRVDWTAHDCAPVPVHRVTGLDAGQARRRLATAMAEATEDLTQAGPPLLLSPTRPERTVRERWSLPDGIPADVADLLTRAATVEQACATGLAEASNGVSAGVSLQRESALRQLRSAAEQTLEEATNLAVAVLAGWRPA